MKKLPIYFQDNTKCPICDKNEIMYYNKKGKEVSPTSKSDETYFARCNNCKNEYFLHWDTYNNIFRLSCKSSTINEFEEEFTTSLQKRNIDNYI